MQTADSVCPVAVTAPEFQKGRLVFDAASDFAFFPAPPEEAELAAWIRLHHARYAVVGTAPYGGELYRALGQGGVVARFGVGCDGIDRKAAASCGVRCTNTPGVLNSAVAEFAVGLMLAAARRIAESSAMVRGGDWPQPTGMELAGHKLLIVGCGAIGCSAAAMAKHGFGMRVAGLGITPEPPKPEWFDEYGTDFRTLAHDADVVSLHIPDTPQNRHFLNAARLAELPQHAIVINTARGGVLDEDALFDALAAGKLAGAGLDVFASEPYLPHSPERDLRKLANVVMTPHLAGNSAESCRRVAERVVANLRSARAGEFSRMDLV